MLYTYVSCLMWTVVGLACLSLGHSWLFYRLAADNTPLSGSAGASPTPLRCYVRTYVCFVAPWLLALMTCRVAVGAMGGGVATSMVQLPLVLLQLGALLLLVPKLSLTLGTRWLLEFGGAWLALQLSWLYLSSSTSLLTSLLWFEVATLSGLLLLSTVALSSGASVSPWRGAYVTKQTQVAYLQTLLVFLWTSGVATLILLWGLGWSLRLWGEVTTQMLQLMPPHGATTVAAGWSLPSSLLGLALLIKLLLQPMQLGLLTFYKRMRLEVLATYTLLYYCFFLVAFVCLFAGYVCALVSTWAVVFVLVLLGSGLALLQGGAGGADVRTTLMFSTAVNLTSLLCILGS